MLEPKKFRDTIIEMEKHFNKFRICLNEENFNNICHNELIKDEIENYFEEKNQMFYRHHILYVAPTPEGYNGFIYCDEKKGDNNV